MLAKNEAKRVIKTYFEKCEPCKQNATEDRRIFQILYEKVPGSITSYYT